MLKILMCVTGLWLGKKLLMLAVDLVADRSALLDQGNISKVGSYYKFGQTRLE